uniref:LIM zinc-binding domain-containing protein n=2 Tax=Magallana gigas TaxID=29159 RepID=A0A8W8JHW9_MAGGI
MQGNVFQFAFDTYNSTISTPGCFVLNLFLRRKCINSTFGFCMTSIMKHQAAIALLIAILSNFSNCDYCPVSAPTVSVVSKCPTTKTEWDEAASRKKCSHMSAKCGNKSPVYHCLLNQWRNETVEVCASNWYISGFCAIYNTEEMKVIDDFSRDCTNLTGGPCPTRYISTDAYMYQGCYGKRNTSTSLPSTDKQVHVSTDCTSPAALIAIIIVLSLLSLILSLLLVLTCQEKISKSVMYSQCMRLRKQTPRKEKDLEKRQDARFTDGKSKSETEILLPGDLEKRQDARFTDEKSKSETEILLPGDQKSVSPRTYKREEKNNTMPVYEESKKNDASDSTTDTSKKDENLRKVNKEEREPTSFGRTNFPRDDRKSECNVKDPSNNIEDLNTKNEDPNVDSEEEGKVIIDASDSTTDTSKKDENLRKVNKEEREPTSFGRTNFPRDDRKSECNVKDPSNNMEDLNTKNEDPNVDSEEEGKVIIANCNKQLGASGLSMDTGRRHEVTTENVSHLSQAQAAPLMNGRGGSGLFGGGDQCPRCGKQVYFAEEVRAVGKKYHKLCLRCASCNKGLDSSNCTDHHDNVYCKNCHGKLFGPKGYGFASGASGHSMVTGNPNEVTKQNVSSYAVAQAAPLLEQDNRRPGNYGSSDMCCRCGKAVFFAEKVMGGGGIYHKACFNCTACGKKLDSTTVTQAEGDIYCKSCYGKHFGPKGFGFGQASQHTV